MQADGQTGLSIGRAQEEGGERVSQRSPSPACSPARLERPTPEAILQRTLALRRRLPAGTACGPGRPAVYRTQSDSPSCFLLVGHRAGGPEGHKEMPCSAQRVPHPEKPFSSHVPDGQSRPDAVAPRLPNPLRRAGLDRLPRRSIREGPAIIPRALTLRRQRW